MVKYKIKVKEEKAKIVYLAKKKGGRGSLNVNFKREKIKQISNSAYLIIFFMKVYKLDI